MHTNVSLLGRIPKHTLDLPLEMALIKIEEAVKLPVIKACGIKVPSPKVQTFSKMVNFNISSLVKSKESMSVEEKRIMKEEITGLINTKYSNQVFFIFIV